LICKFCGPLPNPSTWTMPPLNRRLDDPGWSSAQFCVCRSIMFLALFGIRKQLPSSVCEALMYVLRHPRYLWMSLSPSLFVGISSGKVLDRVLDTPPPCSPSVSGTVKSRLNTVTFLGLVCSNPHPFELPRLCYVLDEPQPRENLTAFAFQPSPSASNTFRPSLKAKATFSFQLSPASPSCEEPFLEMASPLPFVLLRSFSPNVN